MVVDSPPQRPYVGAIARYGASERVESYIRDDARRAVNRVPPPVTDSPRPGPDRPESLALCRVGATNNHSPDPDYPLQNPQAW